MSAAELKVYLNLIDGKFISAQNGQSLEMIDPCNGRAFATLPDSDEVDINAAVSAAQGALGGSWGRMAPVERSRILYRWSQLIMENFEDLAALESRDTGKPITAGRADITATARYFEFYAGAADKLHGQVIPYLDGYSVNE